MKSTSDQKEPLGRISEKDRFVRGEDYEELGADAIRTDLPEGVFQICAIRNCAFRIRLSDVDETI
jgi:hypothetical protein